MRKPKPGLTQTRQLKEMVDKWVRPGTHPIAVKLFKKEPKELPQGL